jgi:DNA-binding MarR family transcriptional regulator
MSNDSGPGHDVSGRLGYLFKHAQALMNQLYAEALAPYGVDARELGVLLLLAGHEPASQQHAAKRLGVDRTTMVAVLDVLEAKGLVSRRPDAGDRRRNVVELTSAGKDLLVAATIASEDAERALLAPLDPQSAQHLRDALHYVVTQRTPGSVDGPGAPGDL